jgi:hypothetical protein
LWISKASHNANKQGWIHDKALHKPINFFQRLNRVTLALPRQSLMAFSSFLREHGWKNILNDARQVRFWMSGPFIKIKKGHLANKINNEIHKRFEKNS